MGISEILDRIKVNNSSYDQVAIVKECRTPCNNNEVSENTSTSFGFGRANGFSTVDGEKGLKFESETLKRDVVSIGGRERMRSVTPRVFQIDPLPLVGIESRGRYNLRNRQGTPI